MEIDASATCRYMKYHKPHKPDLMKACLSLKLVAMNIEDIKALTALYKLYTHGGSLKIEVPRDELTLEGEIGGCR